MHANLYGEVGLRKGAATVSRWSEQEEGRVAGAWTPGSHARPSLAKVATDWTQPTRGTWHRQGWSIVASEVSSCLPRPGLPGILYRVFPPGEAWHVGSFTLLSRAKRWTEVQTISSHK